MAHVLYEGMGQGEEILQHTCFVFDDDGMMVRLRWFIIRNGMNT